MRSILSERNVVVVLFVMVLVTFSLAQEDSKKKLTKIYSGVATGPSASRFLGQVNLLESEKGTFQSPRQ